MAKKCNFLLFIGKVLKVETCALDIVGKCSVVEISACFHHACGMSVLIIIFHFVSQSIAISG